MPDQPANILCATDQPLTGPAAARSLVRVPSGEPFSRRHCFGSQKPLVVTNHIDRHCVSSVLNIVGRIYD